MGFKDAQQRIKIQTATSASRRPEPPKPKKVRLSHQFIEGFPEEAQTKYPAPGFYLGWVAYRRPSNLSTDMAYIDERQALGWFMARRDGGAPKDNAASSSKEPLFDGNNVNMFWRKKDLVLMAIRKEDYDAIQHREWERNDEMRRDLFAKHKAEFEAAGGGSDDDHNELKVGG